MIRGLQAIADIFVDAKCGELIGGLRGEKQMVNTNAHIVLPR